MAQLEFVNGGWRLLPRSQWTQEEIDRDVQLRMSGLSNLLGDQLCALQEDAARAGYHRARITRTRYGWALHSTVCPCPRISDFYPTREAAEQAGREWEASNPGKHFVV